MKAVSKAPSQNEVFWQSSTRKVTLHALIRSFVTASIPGEKSVAIRLSALVDKSAVWKPVPQPNSTNEPKHSSLETLSRSSERVVPPICRSTTQSYFRATLVQYWLWLSTILNHLVEPLQSCGFQSDRRSPVILDRK